MTKEQLQQINDNMGKFVLLSERTPTEIGTYLVISEFSGFYFYRIVNWANDLSIVDEYDFPKSEYGNKSGFYQCDSEWGYVEAMDIVAWAKLYDIKGDGK